ncbi:GntR family transcriptional regulator [Pararhodobacter oceanensis]|uniref:GntR family transcriptional regulator n=1 Tax=Pararhodobacter oceanensis TaxID=2172121 RepID=A0A2T8HQB8_9RHOB|nr:FCD domain-containing protein [Pararhodobacter oceanensis]PVH27639.1 GntR family transcriptional regulator [Pararhodobacter oceanensis]
MDEHRSLTSRAHHRIREMVLSGELAPGARIQIESLREKLDMGASPVREALSILSSEQLVVRNEQRGFWAPKISAADFAILLDTRCRVEGIALADAIAQGGAEWEERIVMLRHRLNTLDRITRADDWEAAHREFHAALISACPSGYLLNFCAQLYDLAVRYRNVARLVAYPERRIADEHSELVDAALARDTSRAVGLLNDHYRKTGEFLFKELSKQEDSAVK